MKTELADQIVELLQSHMSLECKDIAAALKRSQSYTTNVLWRMRGERVEHWPKAGPGRWCLPKNLEKVKAAHAEGLIQRRRERNKRAAEAKRRAEERAAEAWSRQPMLVILTEKDAVPKMPRIGIPSVWDLARVAA